MRYISWIILLYLIGCSRVYNYKTAYIKKENNYYTITIYGKRRLMAHDPISAIKGSTYKAKFTLKVPKNIGQIDAKDIIKTRGYDYVGYILIKKDSLVVNLKYNDTDSNKLRKTGLSGNYNLVRIK